MASMNYNVLKSLILNNILSRSGQGMIDQGNQNQQNRGIGNQNGLLIPTPQLVGLLYLLQGQQSPQVSLQSLVSGLLKPHTPQMMVNNFIFNQQVSYNPVLPSETPSPGVLNNLNFSQPAQNVTEDSKINELKMCNKKRYREKNYQKENISELSLQLNIEKLKKERKEKRNFKSEKSDEDILNLEKSTLVSFDNSQFKECPVSAIEDSNRFMSHHFPEVYKLKEKEEHSKVLPYQTVEKLPSKCRLIFLEKEKFVDILENEITTKPAKLWHPPAETSDSEFVDFLFKIEQLWPFDVEPFSLELSLEFLMVHNYNYDKVKNLIRFKAMSFRNFLIAKKNAFNEIEKIANQNKKSYQLRKR